MAGRQESCWSQSPPVCAVADARVATTDRMRGDRRLISILSIRPVDPSPQAAKQNIRKTAGNWHHARQPSMTYTCIRCPHKRSHSLALWLRKQCRLRKEMEVERERVRSLVQEEEEEQTQQHRLLHITKTKHEDKIKVKAALQRQRRSL